SVRCGPNVKLSNTSAGEARNHEGVSSAFPNGTRNTRNPIYPRRVFLPRFSVGQSPRSGKQPRSCLVAHGSDVLFDAFATFINMFTNALQRMLNSILALAGGFLAVSNAYRNGFRHIVHQFGHVPSNIVTHFFDPMQRSICGAA